MYICYISVSTCGVDGIKASYITIGRGREGQGV